MSALLKLLGFGHEEVWRQHHSVADNVALATLENTRGNTAQHIFLTFKLQSVAGIGSSLKASYHVIVWCEHINNFSFALIAPLQAEKHVNFSCVHFLCFMSVISCCSFSVG